MNPVRNLQNTIHAKREGRIVPSLCRRSAPRNIPEYVTGQVAQVPHLSLPVPLEAAGFVRDSADALRESIINVNFRTE